ncbi:MAG: hypothetical protein A2571_02775 [Candidatus Vogelbacteria bacterium RIFOXYD1_FULL_44_32]|uniref:Peptidase M16 N-terminal domain-containing protein n=1 Tax=Candidatus Vogelbacteria bacterium RIFOXYD1_FULL_44_32 TaxID=1802438 RepID=A0A1G2QDY7_9BACT|nr:MAG: hypothetical protein A2571_02775 [Candidatus Vogelbacteria bacterium RIFOXYD1_FULL_44_32]
MRDRLKFDVTRLPNGITIYAMPWDVPFADIRLLVPVGHINNVGKYLPGSAHMLEHLVFQRSEAFPKPRSFSQTIEMDGGDASAGTSFSVTSYEMTIAAEDVDEKLASFIEHIFHPVIVTADIMHEVGIISNERRRAMSPWYPGEDKTEQHCRLYWKRDSALSIRQRFGDDQDLALMGEKDLLSLHQNYSSPDTVLFVGGNFHLDTIVRVMEKIKTTPQRLEENFEHLSWVNPEYHEVLCEESNRFFYHLGGIAEPFSPLRFFGTKFLGTLLTNTVQGTLSDWLRHERGWVYNIGFTVNRSPKQRANDWELYIPLSEYEQVKVVRGEIHDRILRAISDRDLINRELHRQLSAQLFSYQTLGSAIDEGIYNLLAFGQPISETKKQDILCQAANSEFLTVLYEESWIPGASGEFLALPENV